MKNKLLLVFAIINFIGCKKDKNYKIEYYDNGDTLSIYHFKNGLKQGNYKLFYEGNKLKEKGFYNNGDITGIRKIFFASGRIKKYYYYKYKLPVYYKEFDENGNVINSALGVSSPKETFRKNIEKGDSLLLSYSLAHSMYENAGVILVVYDIATNDTLITSWSDTTFIEQYLRFEEDANKKYHVSVFEVLNDSQEIEGYFYDTLKINVGSN